MFADVDAMNEQFERMLGVRAAAGGQRGFLPPCDVWETDGDVVIALDAPGLHPENITAEVVDGQLVVTGERTSVGEDVVRRYRTERWQGRFVRSFTVPAGIDGEAITADYRDGVLTVTLPKLRSRSESPSTARRRSTPTASKADPREPVRARAKPARRQVLADLPASL
jgi:HSP20 family protein